MSLEFGSIPISHIGYAAVSALALVAAAIDLITRRIPNSIVIIAGLLGLAFAVAGSGSNGLISAISGFGVAFACLMPGYLLGFTGGGDVKLFAALGCFLGPMFTFWAIVIYYPIAAIAVLLYLIQAVLRQYWLILSERHRAQRTLLVASLLSRPPGLRYKSLLKTRLPMAPAIACAVMLAPFIAS